MERDEELCGKDDQEPPLTRIGDGQEPLQTDIRDCQESPQAQVGDDQESPQTGVPGDQEPLQTSVPDGQKSPRTPEEMDQKEEALGEDKVSTEADTGNLRRCREDLLSRAVPVPALSGRSPSSVCGTQHGRSPCFQGKRTGFQVLNARNTACRVAGEGLGGMRLLYRGDSTQHLGDFPPSPLSAFGPRVWLHSGSF